MSKDEEEIACDSDRQVAGNRTKAYRVISFLEVGIKTVVNVPEACADPFRYAAEKGNEKARERIFQLEWEIPDLIDAENLTCTLVDPPNEDPSSEDRRDYERSRWFFDEADERPDQADAAQGLDGHQRAIAREIQLESFVAVVEATSD